MRVTDDRPEHINYTEVTTIQLNVENSYPKSIISYPVATQTYDSSELIQFSANGSGDYDAECGTFPASGYWHCASIEPYFGSEYLIVSWTSDLDGRLTPLDKDWLNFEGRLSAGTHVLTLSLDDGIHEPVESSITVQVVSSAPVLELSTPINGKTYNSSDYIFWNAVNSKDYDGDDFTMTVRSNLLDEPLLDSVSTSETHISQLPSGVHSIEIELTDETGKSSSNFLTLVVDKSSPNANIISPTNLQSFAGGEEIILEEDSYDADNDITFREWQIIPVGSSSPSQSLSSSLEKISLPPGDYDVKLIIRDSQGYQNIEQVRITVENTDPEFDDQSLILSTNEMTTGELIVFEVSVILIDADGTTQDVYATLTHKLQIWNFNLSYDENDDRWKGSVKVRPDESGRPSLKIIARDGVGDDASIDQISRTITVVDVEQNSSSVLLIGGGIGIIVFIIVITMFALRRRRKLDEIVLLESWDSFGKKPMIETDSKSITELEGGIIDGAQEVENEQDRFDVNQLLE